MVYERIKAKNPKKKKVAVVAAMRRLAVRMWYRACAAETPAASLIEAAATEKRQRYFLHQISGTLQSDEPRIGP